MRPNGKNHQFIYIGNFDQANVENWILRSIPHSFDDKDCRNSTEALQRLVESLVKEGLFGKTEDGRGFTRAQERSGTSMDDIEKCRKTWIRMYRVAFKEAGRYHGVGKDWFDTLFGYDQDSVLLPSSSEEIQ